MKKHIVFIIFMLILINQVIFFSCRKKSESCTDYQNKMTSEALEWRPYSSQQHLIFKNKETFLQYTLNNNFFRSEIKSKDVHSVDQESHSKCDEYITYYDIYYCGFIKNNLGFTFGVGGSTVQFQIDNVSYNFDVSNITLDTAKIGYLTYHDVVKLNNNFVSKQFGLIKFEYHDSIYELVR